MDKIIVEIAYGPADNRLLDSCVCTCEDEDTYKLSLSLARSLMRSNAHISGDVSYRDTTYKFYSSGRHRKIVSNDND